MSVNIETLGMHHLSVSDRLELIEQIRDSLRDQVAPEDVPAWHRAELAKRRAQAEPQPGLGKPWREVLDYLDDGAGH